MECRYCRCILCAEEIRERDEGIWDLTFVVVNAREDVLFWGNRGGGF